MMIRSPELNREIAGRKFLRIAQAIEEYEQFCTTGEGQLAAVQEGLPTTITCEELPMVRFHIGGKWQIDDPL